LDWNMENSSTSYNCGRYQEIRILRYSHQFSATSLIQDCMGEGMPGNTIIAK